MASSYGILAPVRITKMLKQLVDIRNVNVRNLWLPRTAITPVSEQELWARYFDVTKIADLIADDARATTYKQGTVQIESTGMANIKQGIAMTQEQINDAALTPPIPGDDSGLFRNWQVRNAQKLLDGIRQRQNKLIVDMLRDRMRYNRNGVQANLTFGMPAAMKTLLTTYWTDHANATPVTDVLTYLYTQKLVYGAVFDTMTMSESMFREMIACTEFQNKARVFIPPQLSYTNLTLLPPDQQKVFAQNLLGVTIEFDDSGYWDVDDANTWKRYRNQDLFEVIFTDSSMFGTDQGWDLANSVVTESIVSQLVGGNVIGGNIPSNVRGPITYIEGQLNPPNIQQWGVARCWPRRAMLQCSGVMTVAATTYADLIPVTLPF